MNNNNNNLESPDSIFAERRINLDQELQDLQMVLSTHLEHFKQHELVEKSNYELLTALVKENITSTDGLLIAWNSALGTIRVLTVIGSIVKWLSGITVSIGLIWSLLSGKIPHI